MSATPLRSHAFTPPPSSGDTGIMSDLYRLSIGTLGAAYYQQQFSRFETLGKAVPSWNSGAAFFTLAWLVLRKMWRPAAIYAGVWLLLALLWAMGLHAQVPLQVEATLCLLTLLLLCVIPGFLANAWYYQQVRSQTLATLTKARSINQARTKLVKNSVSPQRLYIVAALQALIGLAFAAVVYSAGHASAPPTAALPSGPPTLSIPSVASVQQPVNLPFMAPELLDQTVSAPVLLTEAATPPPIVLMPTPSASPTSTSSPRLPAGAPSPAAAPAKKAVSEKKPQPKTKAENQAKPTETSVNLPVPGPLIPGKFYLNAGVYAQASNVDRAIQQLNAAKLNTLRQTVSSNQGELTRLRIGPFDTRAQAEEAAGTAKKLRIETSVFQQPKK